jgi:glutamine synthetase
MGITLNTHALMSTFRFQALRKATDRKPVHVEELDRKSVIFGSNVFGDKAMRQFLTPDAYKAVKNAAEQRDKNR